jgi:hypothetical protein
MWLRCDNIDCGARYYTAATDFATVRRFCEFGCSECGDTVSTDLNPPPPASAGITAELSKTAAHSQPAEPPEQKHRYTAGEEAA